MQRVVWGQARRSSIVCFRHDTKRSVATITWSKHRVSGATIVPQSQSKLDSKDPNEKNAVRLSMESPSISIETRPSVMFSEEDVSKEKALLRLRQLMNGFLIFPTEAGLRPCIYLKQYQHMNGRRSFRHLH